MTDRKPNVLFILTDEWRAQSTGYGGDQDAPTPRIDDLARESTSFENAISGAPVCCPARASLLTGQYPLEHGVYINDVELEPNGTTLGEVYRDAGYRTGYIGKWHLYGSPDGFYGRRRDPIPKEKRFGFDFWRAAECTHDYNSSIYFRDDEVEPRVWEGYDADAQTDAASEFILGADDRPYFLVVSYGPPHFPLHTAPERFRKEYANSPVALRGNVPDELRDMTVEAMRGYYAHIAALDECVARLLEAVEMSGAADDTIVVFTSDHGDMMGSQGIRPDVKTCPWDESVRVPLLIRYPRVLEAGKVDTPVNTPDLMPTLLGLSGLDVPETVSGSDVLDSPGTSSYLNMAVPILWARTYGLGEYRGVRTRRHTYVRSLAGPWLLYDNVEDPLQQVNLVGDPASRSVLDELEAELQRWMTDLDDEFRPAEDHLRRDGLEHFREVNGPIGRSQGPNGSWTSTMEPTPGVLLDPLTASYAGIAP